MNALKAKSAITAPTICEKEYARHSDVVIDPFNNIAIETAGFMCPPLIFPVMYIIPARVRPMTSQWPVKRMDVMSKNVPTHSDTIARNFI